MTVTTTVRGDGKSRRRAAKPIRRRDQLFKAVTALRSVWLELAREYLPKKWLPLLNLDAAKLVNTGTVDTALRERLGDLVLKIPFASGNGYLILGMEQQTRGVFTPARALDYQVRFLKAARKASKDKKPVAACTMVFFGGGMPSSQSTELFTGLNEQEKGLARAALGTIIPVELGKVPDGRLRKKGMAGILMMLLKHRRGESMLPLLETLWPDLRAMRHQEEGQEFVEKVTNYALLAATKKERSAIIKQIEEQIGLEEKEEVMTVASALIQEGKQLGLQEGLRKGRQEGLQEGLLKAARKMLSAGVDIRVVSRAMGLSRQKLAALRKE